MSKKTIADLGRWIRLVRINDEFSIPPNKWKEFENEISHQHFLSRIIHDALKDFDINPEGKRVLDFGCNCGWLSQSLRNYGFEHVTGVDISKTLIDQASLLAEKSGLDGLEFIQGGTEVLEDLPEFDVSFCFGVINHISNPFYLLQKLCEKTREKVFLDCNCLVKQPDVEVDRYSERLGCMSASIAKKKGVFVFNYSKIAMREMMRSVGFRSIYERVYPFAQPKKGYYVRRLFFIANCGQAPSMRDEVVLNNFYNQVGPQAYVRDPNFPITSNIRHNPHVATGGAELKTDAESLRAAYAMFVENNPDASFYVWGTGDLYRAIRDVLPLDRIIAFVENDLGKVGSELDGIPIVSPTEANLMGPAPILIASSHKADIMEQVRYQFSGTIVIP